MLPPIHSSILDRNPRFKVLYQDLSTSRLNPDASTRLIKQQRAQGEIEKKLQSIRRETIQVTALRQTLESTASQFTDLPDEVRESCLIAAAQIRGELSSAELEILRDDLRMFRENLSAIATAMSKQLCDTAMQLSRIFAAEEEGGQIKSNDVSQLPVMASKLLASNAAHANKIWQLRSRVTDLADQVHATHREILEAAVRILEQTLHGSVARGVRAKAEHLAVVAKGLDLKIRILERSDPLVSDRELREALEAYEERLQDLKRKQELRLQQLEEEIKAYESSGTGMIEIGSKYAELIAKCESVTEEIRKLEETKS